ncbi:MAG: hypothetical protein PF689_08990 [Deltaproteobacteria bacterium]|jgi:hypothetical protein|nr:hypothetical protein [Deltaproteobacteria bacterium]
MKIKMKNSTAVLLGYAVTTLLLLIVMIFFAKRRVDNKMDEMVRNNQNIHHPRHHLN